MVCEAPCVLSMVCRSLSGHTMPSAHFRELCPLCHVTGHTSPVEALTAFGYVKMEFFGLRFSAFYYGAPDSYTETYLKCYIKNHLFLHLSIVLSTTTLPNHERILRAPVLYNPLFGYWRLGVLSSRICEGRECAWQLSCRLSVR